MQRTIRRRSSAQLQRLARGLLAAALVWTGVSAVRTQSERPEEIAADAPAGMDAVRPVGAEQVGCGELLWRSPRGLLPLPVVELDVDLSVTGVMIRGRLTQRFLNPTAEVIEALYVFPLPDGAAVHHMEMQIGTRRIVAEVQEKEQARRTYEQARDSGRRTALVDQRRPNLFTTSVANLNPGETVSVVLEYIEEAQYADGRFSLRFPLTFTPRFAPPSSQAPRSDREQASGAVGEDAPELAAPFVAWDAPGAPRAALTVELQPGFPLEDVISSSHVIDARESGGAYRIATRPETIVAARDFLLSWRPRLGREPQAAVFVEDTPDGRYALLMLVPPIPGSEAGLGLPTETLFVIDVSGSMDGPSIAQARRALLASLDRLRPEDRFNILKFNDESEPFGEEFRQADDAALDAAREWVGALEASGGTMIYPALMRGLRMIGDSRSGHAQRIIFLTDGAVANEQELLGGLVEHLGQARLHTVGIGQAPNAWLMRKMARLGRGLCEFVSDGEEAAGRMEAFFERLDRPVMVDIDWRTNGLELQEPYPQRLPDLHAGQPLLLSARLAEDAGEGSVELRGYTRSGRIDATLRVTGNAPRGPGIAVRWARAKVRALMDSLHDGADPAAVRAEVVDVGLDFHLVTDYTSLVAVDDRATALGNAQQVRIAAALPRGGTDGPLRLLAGWALVVVGLGLLLLFRGGHQ